MGAYDGQERVFIPLPYLNKEAGFRLAADAAEKLLSFDEATAVVLRFAELGLVNLNSRAWSAYLRRMMIHDSVGTNLSAIVIPIYHRFC